MQSDPNPHNPHALQGWEILVTRPREQAEELCSLIEQAGGKPLRFPTLDIVATEDNHALNKQIEHIGEYDLVIFISANAVHWALNRIHAQGRIPENVRIAAIGRASARALKEAGYRVDIYPDQQFNSEALLEMPQMQAVAGKHILIFRGEGGREHLAQELVRRGARVEYAEIYRRIMPQTDTSQLLRHWARNGVDAVTATSNEALCNLYEMVGALGRQWLRKTPLVVISERMLQQARELGIRSPAEIADQASDEGILAALCRLRKRMTTESGL